jgi:hypothetical protein
VNEALERLLQAHVRHELAQLQGKQLEASVERGVANLFAWAQTVTLEEVATPERIHGVIQRYVIELRVSGGITELTGELAHLVLESPRSASTRVDQILTPASYEDFADKLVGLEGVRRVLIEKLAHSVTFSAINARLMARGLLDLLTPALLRRPGRLATGLSAIWEPLARSFDPGIEQRLADLLAQYLEQHRDSVMQDVEKRLLHVLQPDSLRLLLDEVWDGVAAMPLSEAFAILGARDLEDFVVLVHEFWLRYRKSDFFREISQEMVEYFFQKYGQQTLALLVDDMGVSEAMVSAELVDFLQPVLEHAARSGVLEQALRERLSIFYGSDAARAALDGPAES